MTDRDRLAADLLHEFENMPVEFGFAIAEYAAECADRLIALGWTRLDEERLARALRPSILELDELMHGPVGETKWRVAAAAIAKAYREDEG